MAQILRAVRVIAGLVVVAGVIGCGGSTTAVSSGGGGGGGGTINTGAANIVYVPQIPATSAGAGQILTFSATANGVVSPTGSVSAPTGTILIAVADDQLGNIYAVSGVTGPVDIREYLFGSSGTATPTRAIALGATSRVTALDGIDVNATGDIAVGQDTGEIDIFGAAQNGTVAPGRYILGYSQTGGGLSPVVVANQVAIDSLDNVYVANLGQSFLGGPSIAEFGFTANGNVTPLRALGTYTTLLPNTLTVDAAGNLYVTSVVCTSGACVGKISIFAAGASGSTAPTRVITGTSTGLQNLGQVKVDSVGNIYVVSASSSGTNPTVLKFAATANGNVAPVSSFTSTSWTSTDGSLAVH